MHLTIGTVQRLPVAHMAPPNIANKLNVVCCRQIATINPITQIPTYGNHNALITHAYNKLEKHTVSSFILLYRDEVASKEDNSNSNTNVSKNRVVHSKKMGIKNRATLFEVS